ncbi:hypothetical protein P3S68_024561 [Capsicum galapagoense]
MGSSGKLGQWPLLAFTLVICLVASSAVADYSYGHTSSSPLKYYKSRLLRQSIMCPLLTTRNQRNLLNIIYHTITI